jgi:hypothetical protein
MQLISFQTLHCRKFQAEALKDAITQVVAEAKEKK